MNYVIDCYETGGRNSQLIFSLLSSHSLPWLMNNPLPPDHQKHTKQKKWDNEAQTNFPLPSILHASRSANPSILAPLNAADQPPSALPISHACRGREKYIPFTSTIEPSPPVPALLTHELPVPGTGFSSTSFFKRAKNIELNDCNLYDIGGNATFNSSGLVKYFSFVTLHCSYGFDSQSQIMEKLPCVEASHDCYNLCNASCLFLLCITFTQLTYYIWTVRRFNALHSHPLILTPSLYVFHLSYMFHSYHVVMILTYH